jgi:hypothetical protein
MSAMSATMPTEAPIAAFAAVDKPPLDCGDEELGRLEDEVDDELDDEVGDGFEDVTVVE